MVCSGRYRIWNEEKGCSRVCVTSMSSGKEGMARKCPVLATATTIVSKKLSRSARGIQISEIGYAWRLVSREY